MAQVNDEINQNEIKENIDIDNTYSGMVEYLGKYRKELIDNL